MGIPGQHLPISVARDEGDLFDRKARFKKTARTFMSKVMKMKVFDFSNLGTAGGRLCQLIGHCMERFGPHS
jgi:hypothetical protein